MKSTRDLPLRQLDEFLLAAERRIALIDRIRPLNGSRERTRLVAASVRGQPASPQFTYANPPAELGELRRHLEALADGLPAAGAWGRLYADRARELADEASIVEALGTDSVRVVAERRFADCAARELDSLLEAWCQEAGEAHPLLHLSHDRADPSSLVSLMQTVVQLRRLPVRVVVRANLQSRAAVAGDAVLVRAGLELTRREAERVVCHELEGHVLPALAAEQRGGLARVGSARGSDEQEGRALLLEQRRGLLGGSRRRELAWRHRLARAVRRGASWQDCLELLRASAWPAAEAVFLAERAFRGGGVGRELVYLPAMLRVAEAFAEAPELETWLEAGRFSVAVARELVGLGEPPRTLAVLLAA